MEGHRARIRAPPPPPSILSLSIHVIVDWDCDCDREWDVRWGREERESEDEIEELRARVGRTGPSPADGGEVDAPPRVADEAAEGEVPPTVYVRGGEEA